MKLIHSHSIQTNLITAFTHERVLKQKDMNRNAEGCCMYSEARVIPLPKYGRKEGSMRSALANATGSWS